MINTHEFLAIDLHCDALFSVRNGSALTKRRRKGHFDLIKMQEGGIWCEVLSLFAYPLKIPKAFWWRTIEKQLNRLEQALSAAPDKWALAANPQQIIENRRRGLRSIIIEIEGLHPIENSADKLEILWNAGVRIFTLTWNNSNIFATSAAEAIVKDNGLTHEGRRVIRQIEHLGGIIDLSHSSDKTFFDVLEMGISPILSHSCIRELRENKRNATLEMVKQLGDAHGIIGINLFPGFLSNRKYSVVTSDDVVNHIESAMSAGGENVVAIGSDFDGVQALPADIPNASAYSNIAIRMSERNFSQKTIEKVVGMNFLKYWKNKETR